MLSGNSVHKNGRVTSWKQLSTREMSALRICQDNDVIRVQTGSGKVRPPRDFHVQNPNTLARPIASKLVRLIRTETYPKYGEFQVFELTDKGADFVAAYYEFHHAKWQAENPSPALTPAELERQSLLDNLERLPFEEYVELLRLIVLMSMKSPGMNMPVVNGLTIKQVALKEWRAGLPGDMQAALSGTAWSNLVSRVGIAQ